jgi:NCS1 family nucleobase:cation symporter-1
MKHRIIHFHNDKLLLAPEPGSFTAEGESSRWSNKDLDPVPRSRKKWEWYHVGGFWIAEGFNVAQMQVLSTSVALGLNPGTALVACLIGNILVTFPVCVMGYIGAKVCPPPSVICTADTDIRIVFDQFPCHRSSIIRHVGSIYRNGDQSRSLRNLVRCAVLLRG